MAHLRMGGRAAGSYSSLSSSASSDLLTIILGIIYEVPPMPGTLHTLYLILIFPFSGDSAKN